MQVLKLLAKVLTSIYLVGLLPASSTVASSTRVEGASDHKFGPWEATVVSKFAPVLRAPSAAQCESLRMPEPLTTPVPLVDLQRKHSALTVSFVIGTDGYVHSALLLKSATSNMDKAVLEAVRSWRYRPAICNGVPTETEAIVDFSSRQKRFGLE